MHVVCCYGGGEGGGEWGGGIFSFNKLNPSPFPQVRGKAVLLYFKLENFGYSFKIHAYFDPDFLVMFINLNIPFDSASQKTSK